MSCRNQRHGRAIIQSLTSLSGQTVTISVEENDFIAGSARVHTLDELIAVLGEHGGARVHIKVATSAQDNYERIGTLVYRLGRHGFDIGAIESRGVVQVVDGMQSDNS